MRVEGLPHNPRLTRRGFVVGTALTATSLGAYVAEPRKSEGRLSKLKLDSLIPPDLGMWHSVANPAVIMARQDGPIDGYDQVVSRTYHADGFPDVMLVLAYGSTQGGSLQLHRPETCYPGQGFRLSDFSDTVLRPATGRPIAARSFTATRDERNERVTYWTRISNSYPRSTAQEYRAILGSVINGVIPDGILVRMSALGTDTRSSERAIAAFFPALIGFAPAARPLLLADR